jgi:hypothetical protein
MLKLLLASCLAFCLSLESERDSIAACAPSLQAIAIGQEIFSERALRKAVRDVYIASYPRARWLVSQSTYKRELFRTHAAVMILADDLLEQLRNQDRIRQSPLDLLSQVRKRIQKKFYRLSFVALHLVQFLSPINLHPGRLLLESKEIPNETREQIKREGFSSAVDAKLEKIYGRIGSTGFKVLWVWRVALLSTFGLITYEAHRHLWPIIHTTLSWTSALDTRRETLIDYQKKNISPAVAKQMRLDARVGAYSARIDHVFDPYKNELDRKWYQDQLRQLDSMSEEQLILK